MAQEDIEMADSSQFDIEQGPSDSVEASLLRSKFDQITSPTRSKFNLNGRRKKVIVLLSVVLALWLVGTMVFMSGGADGVIDYYKNRVGMTGSGSAESSGEDKGSDVSEGESKEEQYDDDDEQRVDESKGDEKAEDTTEEKIGDKPEEKPDEQKEEKPKADDKPEEKPDETVKVEQPKTDNSGKARIGMENLGELRVYNFPAYFLHPPSDSEDKDDGLYFYAERNNFVARKVGDNAFSKQLIDKFSFDYEKKTYKVATFSPNYDMTYAIIATDREAIYRHSSLAYYWLYDIEKGTVTPLTTEDKKLVKLSFAKWSPKYSYISYVKDNDLYIKSMDANVDRVTTDGSERLLNARPDWVYEEEVLASEEALWWAPDESKVVFMKTDETDVPEYNIDYYVQTPAGPSMYPTSKKVIYPKPGFKNPEVSLHVFDLKSKETTTVDRDDSKLGDEWVVYEVFWVDSDNMLIKETDRESNILNVRLFDALTKETKVVLEVNAEDEYDGWIEKFNAPVVIPPLEEDGPYGFVDTHVVDGYNHLVWFPSPTSQPKALTEGQWEVTGADIAYDAEKKLIYFHGSKQPINQHLYTASLEDGSIKAVTDDSKDGFFTATFSPGAKFAYLTSTSELNVATATLVRLSDFKTVMPMTSNTLFMSSRNKYAMPTRTFHRVEVDKYDDDTPVVIDVLEYLPPGFDEKKKYPLLVHYYAGPGSHTLKRNGGYDFLDAVSSSLDAVVLYIEPRGTGGAGWKHRSWANKKIGYWEPRDIVKVSKDWIAKGFIDQEKTACWGWSYGGFTTLKTLEYDQGETFKYGMAVAPVTNWLLYDSIYTERYMDKPENNKEGYEISQIKDVEGLGKVERFLVMHGTADDNVHVQNTYGLLDLLNLKRVENYDVQVFPDSEHSIYYHNANPVVYDKLFSWLRDAYQGDYAKIGHK